MSNPKNILLPSTRRQKRIAEVLGRRLPGLTVVMENIHDPHNVSAILRSCDAVGVVGVELLYTTEKFPRIGKKSSSSASKWVDRRKHTSVESCFATLRAEGYRILATRVTTGSRTIFEEDLSGPIAFVLGNEHRGVSDDALRLADAAVQIPMQGMIESLNVSVATAVLLYETLRQRLARGPLPAPALPPGDYDRLLQDWLHR
ncbi:MAG: RNA methyltransferase [Ignavibacteriae bacterium]|nr:RNA methyltransferase [Ignavibacteriota bacterium]